MDIMDIPRSRIPSEPTDSISTADACRFSFNGIYKQKMEKENKEAL